MFIYIALKDLKIIFRDKKALAIMLLMPALLIFILGSALGPIMEGNSFIKKFPVAVVNKDNGIVSDIFVQLHLRKNMANMFNTFMEFDEENGLEMLKEKKVSSLIIIPQNFTKDFYDGLPVEIEVKSHVDKKLHGDIVKGSVDGFFQYFNHTYKAAMVGVKVFNKNGISIEKTIEGFDDRQAIWLDIMNKMESGIEFSEDEQKSEIVSGMQYYAAAMLVMFMLFGITTGTKLMVEERETNTLKRVIVSNGGKISLIIGKCLGLFIIGFVQALILIVFTNIIYRVHWGSSVIGILLVTISSVFAGSGLGMMIGAISKSSRATEGISQIFIQLFTIAGGGMLPIYIMPPLIKTLAKFTINWWAVKGFYGLMLEEGLYSILPSCGILILMGFVYMSIGVLRFKA